MGDRSLRAERGNLINRLYPSDRHVASLLAMTVKYLTLNVEQVSPPRLTGVPGIESPTPFLRDIFGMD